MSFLSKVSTVSMQPISIPVEVNERPGEKKGQLLWEKHFKKKIISQLGIGCQKERGNNA